jgi:hypothetical protein
MFLSAAVKAGQLFSRSRLVNLQHPAAAFRGKPMRAGLATVRYSEWAAGAVGGVQS